ncbi:tRNA (uridine(34)/cytosine(34)/5-carboxymethylaminomethyluridine(34)-2'-O)-methyltransferase TrmL [Acetivibrio mesophilus]|uniref:Putative tRNA (cytidine(34)-2'-O)-methyltransferase n=1 Tax=Acetivibrio mesophilus TaxID=2487273 RepID=A0A4Q0I5N0_9FIRM|nr:tRNA (uridine(34)/cytosine(34)/5-carboxymethylaminomethyluridine(34)-2'-O)-methyltransferase TrmL [Acetivibrio mesophilus]ODM26026.1 tRNA (cytosine(34)-2'-O)-methyltransferase TrmL [Clostridium sp. Bc-iso-3]RXE59177.1 tRNA (uridine(34)/cytosine(34)/5-carboxymethylaminomethyluridine(34)-2'-O)-methyltransferase TrmL [Acetivibrio mesophilus]HHV29189.1 tRNA (uridine(34)/cytosine(34)/5-carboxymethylaminomethyluridine(34)-2'-O)-methyltransferase TrmL [Clostridium sp.]
MAINVVLVEPEIPQNTGNIVRTCAAVGVNLHLIKPLGFSVEDRYLRRAGLDYWDKVNIKYYDNFNELRHKYKECTFYYSTTKAQNSYADVRYPEDCFIVFGKETAGLPEELLVENREWCIRIPMKDDIRSLNLSNSVAVIVYEALRQNNFAGLAAQGELTKYCW